MSLCYCDGFTECNESPSAPSNIFGGGKAQDIRLFESKKQLEQEKKEQEALSKEASSTDKNDMDSFVMGPATPHHLQFFPFLTHPPWSKVGR